MKMVSYSITTAPQSLQTNQFSKCSNCGCWHWVQLPLLELAPDEWIPFTHAGFGPEFSRFIVCTDRRRYMIGVTPYNQGEMPSG